MKFIFLIPSITQPRCLRRIQSFYTESINFVAYGYKREKYLENIQHLDFDINIIDTLKDKDRGSKRIRKVSGDIKKIISKYKNEEVIFYCFSLEFAFHVYRFSKNRFIYENSDLLYTYSNNSLYKLLFKQLDRWIIKKSLLTVLTSKGFVEYLGLESYKNIMVQPNQVDERLANYRPEIQSFDTHSVRFAYVGAPRYPNTILRFARIIGEKFPKYSFSFYGEGGLKDEIKSLVDKSNNIYNFGSFKNPDDLFEIYANIDVVVACYDATYENERYAEPNKLYEALYFRKPIICSSSTFLGAKVEHLGIGLSIDSTSDDEIIKLISSLDKKTLESILNNIKKISLNEIVYNSRNFIHQIEKALKKIGKDL